MKTVSLLSVLVISICLIGCENTELINCQQENNQLQGQLDQANTTIAEKDATIKTLKIKNTEDQQKAMESITTMMTKQTAADKKIKDQLAEKTAQVKKLEAKIGDLKAKVADLEAKIAADDEDEDDDDDMDNQ